MPLLFSRIYLFKGIASLNLVAQHVERYAIKWKSSNWAGSSGTYHWRRSIGAGSMHAHAHTHSSSVDAKSLFSDNITIAWHY